MSDFSPAENYVYIMIRVSSSIKYSLAGLSDIVSNLEASRPSKNTSLDFSAFDLTMTVRLVKKSFRIFSSGHMSKPLRIKS